MTTTTSTSATPFARPGAADMSGPTGPFWDGIAQGRFMLQYDAAAGRHHFYAKPLYDRSGTPLPWQAANGTGTVVAYTLSRVPAPGFEQLAPYVLALVQLDEGPRVFAPLTGRAFADLQTGLRARVRYGTPAPAPYSFEVDA